MSVDVNQVLLHEMRSWLILLYWLLVEFAGYSADSLAGLSSSRLILVLPWDHHTTNIKIAKHHLMKKQTGS